MKRKHDEGYALLYVLIILLVLFAICAAISSIALRNYQGQVQSVREMGQLYQAEGEIEKFVALAGDVSGISGSASNQSSPNDAQTTARMACWNAYSSKLTADRSKLDSTTGSSIFSPDEDGSDMETYEFSLTYKNGEVEIKTNIKVSLTYEDFPAGPEYDSEGNAIPNTYSCTSQIKSASSTYLSYSITHLSEGGGGSS